jgi:hypothetical protein
MGPRATFERFDRVGSGLFVGERLGEGGQGVDQKAVPDVGGLLPRTR